MACLEHAYQVLRTLRTSSIAAIVELLTPLLHIDPVLKLPPEITFQIFSYLSASVLLNASRVSKMWRARTLDARLWKEKFRAEGWTLDLSEVKKFEKDYRIPTSPTKARSRKADGEFEDRKLKRQAVNKGDSESPDLEVKSEDARIGDFGSSKIKTETQEDEEMRDMKSNIETESRQDEDMGDMELKMKTEPQQDEEMRDMESRASVVGSSSQVASYGRMDSQQSQRWIEPSSSAPSNVLSPEKQAPNSPKVESDLFLKNPLAIPVSPDRIQLNFHHVYKQKRKLEANWAAGSYKSFQLPHRDHPEEAHSECVYTIQYSGKYLVSGSRDKTLRIWDLDTQRLIRRPLNGHKGSVLCLQFDAHPKEDLIVSGSSDTDVILWQFSTGKILRRLKNAHNESVLNLKFDHRFLVTCSKDKLIKIWNRKELRPGEKNYPVRGVEGGGRFPSYIVDLSAIQSPGDMEQYLTPEQMEPIKEYSLIMRIDSHSAAVNAVHIFKDQLVSASGDRFLKVFNIHTGAVTAICMGHNKGIACVQYDGKRIVSGSSDDTIRIYDPISQAEVACLQGHSKLVRTIQASFGDFPGTEGDLEVEARESDKAYYEATWDADDAPASSSRAHRTRERNPGSRRPQDIMALGAKIPPGGGGSRWARIVSGSYDETVIIWRKTGDGRWVIGHRLKQAEALRAAGAPLEALSNRHDHAARVTAHQQHIAHLLGPANGHGPNHVQPAPIAHPATAANFANAAANGANATSANQQTQHPPYMNYPPPPQAQPQPQPQTSFPVPHPNHVSPLFLPPRNCPF